MVSRVGIAVALLLMFAVAVTSSPARQPPIGTAIYVVRHDPRLCPSPLCGGYWVAVANGARTICADGLRHLRCYVARVVDATGQPVGGVPEGALVPGALDIGSDDLAELTATTAYAPAGDAAVSGGYYRVVDLGIRCIRAPCFSFRATRVNGSTRIALSDVDLAAASASSAETARAKAMLGRETGLYARGRFASTPDGGRIFRALRVFLRAPLPRA